VGSIGTVIASQWIAMPGDNWAIDVKFKDGPNLLVEDESHIRVDVFAP
jgi:hypothetical protein